MMLKLAPRGDSKAAFGNVARARRRQRARSAWKPKGEASRVQCQADGDVPGPPLRLGLRRQGRGPRGMKGPEAS